MSKVLIYSQEDLDLILELEKEKNEELQQENEQLKADYGTKVQVERDLLKEENKILKENAENNDKVVDKVNWENMLLKKENKQLKDNWNKLKDYIVKEYYIHLPLEASTTSIIILINKMQELEGSGSNDRPKTR